VTHALLAVDFERLYREVSPSVVSIYLGAGGYGAGSGFVYDRDPDDTGYVVTNQHVVAAGRHGEDETPQRVDVRFADGTWCEGRVVGVDAYTDLALVAVADLPETATPLTVACETPVPGRPVAALGNPMGLDGTMTVGVVSGVNRSMPTTSGFAIPDVVQTDAPINPGNSGGPLVALVPGVDPADPAYEVVGVNRARQGDNIGFAISPLLVDRVVPSLRTAGRHRHPYLRVRTLDVSPTVAARLETVPGGILVVDAPVETGLRAATTRQTDGGFEIPVAGDVIVAVDDHPVDAHEELMRYLLLERAPGDAVTVTVVHDGERRVVEMTLGERPPVDDEREGRGGGGGRIPIR
jgi:serine protease Do